MRPMLKKAARLMHEGSLAMAELEHNGVRVDMRYLDSQIKGVGREMKEYESKLTGDKIWREWKKMFGDKSKLGSKEQLGKVIFEKMGYARKKGQAKKVKSENGDYQSKREGKNDENAFGDCDLPFVKDYFKWQKLIKLKTTYLEGIMREQVDGRIHPFFNLHKTITYRSSSNMVNWQNVPVRNKKIAEIIRRCYIPEPGEHFVEIDYAQQEVRVAACHCKDRRLIAYINDPKTDMHRDMAMKMFMLTEKEVGMLRKTDSDVRDFSKNRFVFPEFYGSTYFQCAPALWSGVLKGTATIGEGGPTLIDHLKAKGIKSLGDCEAGASLKNGTFVAQVQKAEKFMWETTFHEYTSWKLAQYDEYLRKGFFDLFTGFRVEALLARNDVLNYRIQGDAFLCLLQAMVWILQDIKKYKMRARMVGEIHDSHQASVHPKWIQDYLSLCKEIMVDRLRKEWDWIIVPLDTESEVAAIDESWGSKKVWSLSGGRWSLPTAKVA